MIEPTRYKLTFSKGEGVKYISHLDLMRVFERAIRRADLPLDYSLGFNPRPKLSIAAPAAVGVMTEADLMDVILTHPVELMDLEIRLNHSLPEAIRIHGVEHVPIEAPSLQSLVISADYQVKLQPDTFPEVVKKYVELVLAAETLPRTRKQQDKVKQYDLRPLVHSIEVGECTRAECTLFMRLENSSKGSGRPEEVVAALNLPTIPLETTRLRLHLAGEG